MGKVNKGMMSSLNEEYETPDWLFDIFDKEYHFVLDAAASAENAKVSKYYTKEDNALTLPWEGSVWCNPPYGEKVEAFVDHAIKEHLCNKSTIVMLVAARTDTKWFRRLVTWADRVIFISGRIRFVGTKTTAPFPSAIIVMLGEESPYPPTIEFIEHHKEHKSVKQTSK